MRVKVPTVDILGVPVATLTREDALHEIDELLETPEPALLAYVNANSANLALHDAHYRQVLRDADLVLNDGSGVAFAAKRQGGPFPENLNGADLNPEVLRLAAKRGLGVFLLGGLPEVSAEAGRRLSAKIPGLRIVGTRKGHFPLDDASSRAVAEEVRASGADVLMLAMGNPIQETWLAEYLPVTGVRLGVAVGGFLDFESGRLRRAPLWMRKAGVEWVFRFILEPRRLFVRYIIGNPVFIYRVLRYEMRSKKR